MWKGPPPPGICESRLRELGGAWGLVHMCGCAGWEALCSEHSGVPGEAPQSPFLWQVQGSALLSALPLQALGSLLAPTWGGACTKAWLFAPRLRHIVLWRDTPLPPRPASAAPAPSPAQAENSQASDGRCCGPGVSVLVCDVSLELRVCRVPTLSQALGTRGRGWGG